MGISLAPSIVETESDRSVLDVLAYLGAWISPRDVSALAMTMGGNALQTVASLDRLESADIVQRCEHGGSVSLSPPVGAAWMRDPRCAPVEDIVALAELFVAAADPETPMHKYIATALLLSLLEYAPSDSLLNVAQDLYTRRLMDPAADLDRLAPLLLDAFRESDPATAEAIVVDLMRWSHDAGNYKMASGIAERARVEIWPDASSNPETIGFAIQLVDNLYHQRRFGDAAAEIRAFNERTPVNSVGGSADVELWSWWSGLIHRGNGNPSEAIRAFSRCLSLEVSRLGTTHDSSIRTVLEIAGCLEQMGHMDTAADRYSEAAERILESDAIGSKSARMLSVGEAWSRLGFDARASTAFLEAESFGHKAADPARVAQVCFAAGSHFLGNGNWAKAASFFRMQGDAAKKMSHRSQWHLWSAKLSEASALSAIGQRREALAAVSEAQIALDRDPVLQKQKSAHGRIQSVTAAALLAGQQSDPGVALELALQAEAQFKAKDKQTREWAAYNAGIIETAQLASVTPRGFQW